MWWCFWTVVLERTLDSCFDGKIKPVNPKGNQPWLFIGRNDLKLKLKYFGHLMGRADSLEKTLMLGNIEGKRRWGQQRMRWLDSITNSVDMNLSKLQEIVKNREAWHTTVHGVAKSWTWLGDWTTTYENLQYSTGNSTQCFAVAAAAAKSLQSCQTLCDPIDGSPPGSPVPGILQARTLEWVAISYSNAWKWKVKVKSLSRVPLFVTPWTAAYQAPLSMEFSRQEYWSGLPLPSPNSVLCDGLNRKKIQNRGDIHIHIVDSLCCTAETNITL